MPIWVEASAAKYIVIVRPAGWITLSKDENNKYGHPHGDDDVSVLESPRDLRSRQLEY